MVTLALRILIDPELINHREKFYMADFFIKTDLIQGFRYYNFQEIDE